MAKTKKVHFRVLPLKRALAQARQSETLQNIAKRARISPYWLYSVNQGKTINANLEPAERLAGALNVHISDIARPWVNKRQFGRYLRVMRQNRYIKAATIAKLLKLDPPAYCRLEKGQRRPPAFAELMDLSSALGLNEKETVRLLDLAGITDL